MVFKNALERLGNDLVEIKESDLVRIDIKYATTDNFTGEDLYQGFNRAILHKLAAKKLEKACEVLKIHYPSYRFIIYDTLRPRHIQQKMWNYLQGQPEQQYLADPQKGSLHNFGFALDLSLEDKSGNSLDMGTAFDDFSERAQPILEEELHKKGELTQIQLNNRKILKRVMEEAGFTQLKVEWWHFNAIPIEEAREKFKIIE